MIQLVIFFYNTIFFFPSSRYLFYDFCFISPAIYRRMKNALKTSNFLSTKKKRNNQKWNNFYQTRNIYQIPSYTYIKCLNPAINKNIFVHVFVVRLEVFYYFFFKKKKDTSLWKMLTIKTKQGIFLCISLNLHNKEDRKNKS